MIRPLAILVSLVSTMTLSDSAHAAPPDPGFLRLHGETRGFLLGIPTHARPTPDGKEVLFLRSTPRAPMNSLYAFDVATGKTRELLTPEKLLHGGTEQLSPAERARRERMRVST